MAKIPRLRPVTDPAEIQPQKRVAELIRVPADKPLCGVLVSAAPFHMPTHWTGSRTVICAGQGACEHCPHRGIKDYYLIALLDKLSGVVSWVELTEYAATSLLSQIREAQRPFHGTVVKIQRERKTMKAPIKVAVDLYANVHGRLPKPVEPTETLERVFNSQRSTTKPQLKAV